MTTPAAEVSGRSLLIKWANDQDHWVREVVAAVLEGNAVLSGDRVQAAFEHMLVEKGLAVGERGATPALVEGASPGQVDEPLSLVSIEDVRNVNALAPSQSVAFNAKLTVLFGRNGSGKTGYARILKRISSVRREQRILPDITTGTDAGPPEAQIRYRIGAVEQTCAWKGEAGIVPLTRVDVFDAQDAPTYVDGDLTYVYTPADVALFRHVSAAMDGVRDQLEEAKRDRAPGPNVFTQHFQRDVPFYAKVDTLGAATNLDELRSLANVTPEEEASLEGLRETVEALGSQSLQVQLQAAQTELDMCAHAKATAERLLAFDATAHDTSLARVGEADRKRTDATRTAFTKDAPPGFLGPEWRSFVEAGERYIESLDIAEYPASDQTCVYCQQPLTKAAVALLRKYRDFCNDQFEREAADARSALEVIRRSISKMDLRPLDQLLRQHSGAATPGADAPAYVRDARLVLAKATSLQDALGSNSPLGSDPARPELPAALARLVDVHAEAAKRVSALKGRSEEREQSLAEARSKKALLEARFALRKLLPSIEVYVDRSKWVSLADGVLKRFKQAAKTLTESSKLASERLINHDFEKGFREECRCLNAPHVNLDFKGQKGQAARRKLLRPEYRLSETLSEGEQKVVALADFLAEASLRTTNAPVVFDDPVTSLDYERIREVASRLAALAQDRQVIVFTHNIWFAVELLERFRDRRQDCAYYDIRAVEGRRGVVSGGTHPRSDSVNDLKARINRSVAEAKKVSGETQDALVYRAYAVLRALCEVAVEAEFLQNMIRRYEPNVMLTALPKIKPQAFKDAAEKIFPVYQETCRYIEAHSQPLEHLNVVRTVDELERDLQSVLQAIDGYRKASG